jgi:DNA-binding NarL/FixJ family response regulator
MKIIISLSSYLLGVALRESLVKEHPEYHVEVEDERTSAQRFLPDFIITDCHALRRGAVSPDTAVKVVLLDYGLAEEEVTSLLLTHKIDGVIATNADLSHFMKAVQTISTGQVWIDNRKVKALIQHGDSVRSAGDETSFSKKEREIVILISRGLINREIADRLCISEQTVKTHISRIFRKVNVSRRSQLVPLALKLMVPDSP